MGMGRSIIRSSAGFSQSCGEGWQSWMSYRRENKGQRVRRISLTRLFMGQRPWKGSSQRNSGPWFRILSLVSLLYPASRWKTWLRTNLGRITKCSGIRKIRSRSSKIKIWRNGGTDRPEKQRLQRQEFNTWSRFESQGCLREAIRTKSVKCCRK